MCRYQTEELPVHGAVTSGVLVGSDDHTSNTSGPHGAHMRGMEFSSRTSEVARHQADGTWRYVIDHPYGAVDTASASPG